MIFIKSLGRPLRLALVLGVGAVSACSVNVNSNQNSGANKTAAAPAATETVAPATGAATPAAAKAHWTATICSSRAGELTLQAGPSKTDSQTFATWQTGSSQKIYELPARVQNLPEVHFRAIASEHQPVELCVLYDGRPKKRVGFNEGTEEHTVKAGDGDDDSCRCTQ